MYKEVFLSKLESGLSGCPFAISPIIPKGPKVSKPNQPNSPRSSALCLLTASAMAVV